MDIQKIQQYKSAFDLVARTIKDDDDSNIEVWYARELQEVLGYARWENFVGAVGRAIESCKMLGINVDDHAYFPFGETFFSLLFGGKKKSVYLCSRRR